MSPSLSSTRRFGAMTRANVHRSFIKAQRDVTGDVGLCFFDERLQRLAQRREPLSVIRISSPNFGTDRFFVMQRVAVQRECFQFAVRRCKEWSPLDIRKCRAT